MRSEHLTKTDTEGLKWVSIPLKFILEDKELRLNAGSYSLEYIEAVSVIESLRNKGYVIEKLGKLAEKVFVGVRSKRLFTNSKEGIPYLMPVDIFNFFLRPRKWVKVQTRDLNNWFVEPYTILITQSGAVGRTLIANELFKGKSLSPNLIRFIPKKEHLNILGYIYAWLNTKYCQAMLTKNLYGATVKHIEPHHVAELPIPRIHEDKEREIHESIMKAHKLRESAQKMLMEAEELFYKELKLPRLDEEQVEYFGGEKGREVKAFTIKSSELEDRLDAGYYVPLARKCIEILRNNSLGKIRLLHEVADAFVPPRFKRPYVENKDEGVALIQGKYIPLVRLLEVKYIWKRMKNIEKYRVRKGWILITRSGTIGQISLVSSLLDKLIGSDHLIRVIPKQINPGYLTLFLLSDYGQVQFKKLIYGGVVDEIGEAGELFKYIQILKPKDENLEKDLGSLVLSAYEKKDLANKIEQEAVEKLEYYMKEVLI